MRKYGWLLVIAILITLSGCGQTESVSVKAYCYPAVRLSGEEETSVKEETVLMKSYAEYQDFLEQMMREDTGHDRFFAKLSSYSGSYFQQNMLAFIGFERSDFGEEIFVKSVTYEGDAVQIDLQGWSSESTVSASMVNYGVIVELPVNRKSNSVKFSFTDERPPVTRTGRNDKVVVTGVGEVLDLSYAQIADKLNEAGNDQVFVKIILSDDYKVNYHIPSDLTKDEVQKLAEQYRSQVEAHYTAKNQEIMDAQDLTGLELSFSVDPHMPWVYAEFSSGITEEDVELIHELTKENRQIKEIVLSPGNRK